MKVIRRLFSVLALATGHGVLAAEPTVVIIDPSPVHTTTYVSLPDTGEFRTLKTSLLGHQGAYLARWEDFKRQPKKYIAAYIRRNDEPESDVAAGLLVLLQDYPGRRFGLTWYGSLAFSDENYRYAGESYRAFQGDPDVVALDPERRRKPGHAPITPGACDRNRPRPKLFE